MEGGPVTPAHGPVPRLHLTATPGCSGPAYTHSLEIRDRTTASGRQADLVLAPARLRAAVRLSPEGLSSGWTNRMGYPDDPQPSV